MIKNSIIFYYKDDYSLNDYFYNSANFGVSLLNQKADIKQSHVVGNDCNFAYIEEVEFKKHTEKSLLLIYSHGDDSGFYKSNDDSPFLNSKIDFPMCIENGLIYTNACLTGNLFAQTIIDKKASFYGYSKSVIKNPMYEKAYIECDNWGLHYIIKGYTLIDSKKEAKKKFNVEIDKCNNIFTASHLREARDSLVVYGNTSERLI